MNYDKIKEYCDDRKISLPDLAKKIDLTKSGLYLAISKKTLTVEKLEKISNALEVPIWYFFDLDPETPYIKEIEQKNNTNKINEETLAQMTKVIDELTRKQENIKTVTYFYGLAREYVVLGLIELIHYEVMNNYLLDFLESTHDNAALEQYVKKMVPIMETRKKVDKLILGGYASYTHPGGPIKFEKLDGGPIELTSPKSNSDENR